MEEFNQEIQHFWLVHEDDRTCSQGMLYHEQSKLGEFRVFFGDEDPKKSIGMRRLIMSVQGKSKEYPYFPEFPVNADWSLLNNNLGNILQQRKSRRNFVPANIPQNVWSTLLQASAGVNKHVPYEAGKGFPARTYPSGGGLYPVEVYGCFCQKSV